MSARRAALDVLDGVLSGKATLDRAFERSADRRRLEGPDRAFARALAATTLRRMGEIDQALQPFLKRPLPRKALTARNILRLGATQLMFLKTPAHAAVGETTDLATGQAAGYRGLANAVLRRLATEGAAEQETPWRANTPGWLWESWRAAYGIEAARAIAEANGAEAPLDLTLLKGDPATWAATFGAELLPTGTLRLPSGIGAVADLEGYAEGAWQPQDAAAALPARLLGDVAGKAVIDLCAAPGGKSAQLAAAGAQVTVVDQGAARMARLNENMARLGLDVTTVVADAVDWRPETLADAVLLDAPCSATGTIRRHPDIPWTKTTADVRALAELQAALLDAAAEMVRPGGTVVYACCSLQPEEGEAPVGRFLKHRADFVRVPITPEDLPGLPAEAINRYGDLRTAPAIWADKGGMDGFYAARLQRVS